MKKRLKNLWRSYGVIISLLGVCLVAIIGIAIFAFSKKEKAPSNSEGGTHIEQEAEQNSQPLKGEEEKQDPEVQLQTIEREEGAKVEEAEVEQAAQEAVAKNIAMGIDVSSYQGTIDWNKVGSSGVRFAMIRAGYRTIEDGVITEDLNAKYNMQKAAANNIAVGVYFFSTAVTEEEARIEANWVLSLVKEYKITYPIAYDCEGFRASNSRQKNLSAEERSNIAVTFCKTIKEAGYTAAFYGSRNDLTDGSWNLQKIGSVAMVWLAQYPSNPYPTTAKADYSGQHVMWQYTNKGAVSGIKGNVDLNLSYLDIKLPEPKPVEEGNVDSPADTQEEQKPNPEANMKFTACNESVTPKDNVNLRDIPSQGDDSKIIANVKNGEVFTRIATSPSGWSKVEYNGQTLYCVSSMVTTDTSYKKPEESNIKTVFTACDEKVKANADLNLRNIPSTTREDSEVVVRVPQGTELRRLGVNTDVGWSKVEYNGQTLYCVSRYLDVIVEE